MFRFPASALLLSALCTGLVTLLTGCKLLRPLTPPAEGRTAALRSQLAPHLEVLGARNWIVVADPTCPILAGEGVDVLVVDAGAAETLREVLSTLDAQGALTPRLWVNSELEHVTEKQAPGMRRYRRELRPLLSRRLHYEMTERIIGMQLAQAAETYRILYIKTSTPLPYSSIAIELDSGYWNSDAEAELRERMEKLSAPRPATPLPRQQAADDTI